MPHITAEVEPRLYEAIRVKLQSVGCSDITTGGVEDHAHVVFRFPPVHSIAYLVQQAKGSSSHLLTHEVPGFADFKWQGGYGAFTLSESELPRVRAYVLNQKEHHARRDVLEDWEQTWEDD